MGFVRVLVADKNYAEAMQIIREKSMGQRHLIFGNWTKSKSKLNPPPYNSQQLRHLLRILECEIQSGNTTIALQRSGCKQNQNSPFPPALIFQSFGYRNHR